MHQRKHASASAERWRTIRKNGEVTEVIKKAAPHQRCGAGSERRNRGIVRILRLGCTYAVQERMP